MLGGIGTFLGTLCFVILLTEKVEAQAPQLSTAIPELVLGPISLIEQVQGVPVSIVSNTYLSLNTNIEGLQMKARVVADLSGLQAKIGAIIDTISLPRDNCRSYSANNPVVTISGKELKAEGRQATLWLYGYVDVWDCRENPVPNSKLEWQTKKVGWGIKTKVPVIVTWPGSPIKNHLATQPFDISLPVSLMRVSQVTVSLQLGNPNIHLGGQSAAVTNGLLAIAGVDISSKTKYLLNKSVDPAKFQVSIPKESLGLNPVIQSASFEADGGGLTAVLMLSAEIPTAHINNTISELVKKLQK